MTIKKSKLNDKQVAIRAKAIRDYGISNFMQKTGMPRGTINAVLCGYRDSKPSEAMKQSKQTGIPMDILNPVKFGLNNNKFVNDVKSQLKSHKKECSPEQWAKITKALKDWL